MRIAFLTTAALALCATSAAADDHGGMIAQGAAIFKETCDVCHGAAAKGPDRAAPPVFAVKNHYSGLTDQGEFVDAVAAFIRAPNEAAAMMPGAIGKFGLMPAQTLTEEDARAVAEFLYATDFSMPDWYNQHYREEHGEAPKY